MKKPPAAIDALKIAHALCRAHRELVDVVQQILPPLEQDPESIFIPNAFQKGILDALANKAMRTDALANKVGSRSRLFDEDGLPELVDEGLVCHHKRIGYYRPDAPPAEMLAN